MKTYTHKLTGWTRTRLTGGDWLITPSDNSGTRTVAFLSAGTWQNLPADDKAREWEDRAVLRDGAPLPDWAMSWLTGAARAEAASGRRALRAAIADADFAADMRDGW